MSSAAVVIGALRVNYLLRFSIVHLVFINNGVTLEGIKFYRLFSLASLFKVHPFLLVGLSIFIIWMSPFLVLGVSVGCFHFYCIFHGNFL